MLTLIIITIFTVLIFINSIGIFKEINIVEKKIDKMVLIYEEYLGSYKNTKLIQDRLYYKLLKEKKIETFKSFGIYYDNPKKVKKSRLKSRSGCILEVKDYEKINKLKKDFKIMFLERGLYIYSEFPLQSYLSILGGIIKVYPKLKNYIKNKQYKDKEIIEIYDLPNKKIIYIIKK